MIRPFCAIVFALKFLQKSMMLTPCCPSAGPTGGAGVALPAGICNFTWPITFFAIFYSRAMRSLYLLHLKEIEFNRRRPAEDRHHYLQCVSIGIHFIDNSGEACKWAIDDLDCFAFFKREFRLRLIGRGRNAVHNLLNFLFAERRRILAGADKTRNAGCVFHQMPRLVAGTT